MQLTKNFSLEELTSSDYAERHEIQNVAPATVKPELLLTAHMLQKIRDYLSEQKGHPVPLIITSGYRSPQVNDGIGSNEKSDHILGLAADFKTHEISAYDICQMLIPKLEKFGIGQLINELTWVHVSRKRPLKKINEILTVDRLGTRPGIHVVRQ